MKTLAKVIRQQSFGIVACILAASGLTLAATGQPAILGRSNSADKATVLASTGTGPVLTLRAKAGQPALKVNSNRLIGKLNADLLDGKHASAFAPAGSSYTKAQSDSKYSASGAAYTKAQSDAKYTAAGSSYTKSQGDARYGRVLYQASWSGSTPDGSSTKIFDHTVVAPSAGTLMLVFTMLGTGAVETEADMHIDTLNYGSLTAFIGQASDTFALHETAGQGVPVGVFLRNTNSQAASAQGTFLAIFYADAP